LWWRTSIRKSFSIAKISFPDSIEIDDRRIRKNTESSMNWTFRGITIDWSDDHKKASDSIRVNREFDSNVIDESELQYEKHSDPRSSTWRGIHMDWSDEYENANDSIRVKCEFDSNVIDESDWHSEKQLIQVLFLTIYFIQFESSVNVIQMKSREVSGNSWMT
jgi:hypothetical protein